MFSYRFDHIYCSRDMGKLKYTTQGTFGGKSMNLDEDDDENETT